MAVVESMFVNQQNSALPSLPIGVLKSLWRGTEVVSNRPALLLIPVLLDLMLWLGPHLGVASLIDPAVQFLNSNQGWMALSPEETKAAVASLADLARHLNLLAVMAFFPLFPPSVMATRLPIATPWGSALTVQIGSPVLYFGLVIVLVVSGMLVGSAFWALVARALAAPRSARFDLREWLRVWRNVVVLSLGAGVAALIVGVPIIFGVGLVGVASTALGQVLLVLMGGLVLWVLMFFVFSLHGMVLNSESIVRAMGKSAEVVRWSYPSTLSLILLTALVLMGTNAVWALPSDASWAGVVGVLGNAYTSTALVAGSLVYYQDRRRWVEELRRYLEARSRKPQASVEKKDETKNG
jgi:hypothetical protein